jgi:hypothetical protein
MQQYKEFYEQINIKETIKELKDSGFHVISYDDCLGIKTDNPVQTAIDVTLLMNKLSSSEDIPFNDYMVLFGKPKTSHFNISYEVIYFDKISYKVDKDSISEKYLH